MRHTHVNIQNIHINILIYTHVYISILTYCVHSSDVQSQQFQSFYVYNRKSYIPYVCKIKIIKQNVFNSSIIECILQLENYQKAVVWNLKVPLTNKTLGNHSEVMNCT